MTIDPETAAQEAEAEALLQAEKEQEELMLAAHQVRAEVEAALEAESTKE